MRASRPSPSLYFDWPQSSRLHSDSGPGLSPAYNNPLISPLLGRDVGPGALPVTMLRWCRQPSPSKATLALFLFVTGAKSPGQGRSPGPLEFGNATHESPFPSCVQEALTTVGGLLMLG